jgi:hypothetical protein
LIGSLLRFSSGKDGEEVKRNDVVEDVRTGGDSNESDTSENHPSDDKEVTSGSSSDVAVPETEPDDSIQADSNQDEPSPAVEPQPLPETETYVTRQKDCTLDELGEITRRTLADENLEVSKVKPFIWSVIEAYTDRFQAFPFDARKALFNYLELDERPGTELIELVKRIEVLYEKQQGEPMRKPESSIKESEPPVAALKTEKTDMPTHEQLLDEELKELRETLKYAAMVGERLDDAI